MSKEDNISKWFIENQEAFEKEPSGDLWDKISSNLDDQLPVAKKPRNISIFLRLSVAASFLLFVTIALFIQFNTPTVISLNIEKNETVQTPFDSLLEAFEEDETLPVHLADLNQQQEKEDALQEKVIVEAIRKTIERNDKKDGDIDKLSIDQVEIATASNKLYEIDELLDEMSEEENIQKIEPENISGLIKTLGTIKERPLNSLVMEVIS